jgi:hypothetical protein
LHNQRRYAEAADKLIASIKLVPVCAITAGGRCAAR